jgi:hypothetical protein
MNPSKDEDHEQYEKEISAKSKERTMKRFASKAFVLGMVGAGILALLAGRLAAAADNDPAVLQADKAFVQALAKHDHAAVSKVLDADFMWTDAAGETTSKDKVLAALPTPMMDDESGAQVSERTYGEAAGVQIANGKQHAVRIWVKRPAGWRLLVYQEVKQADVAPTPGPTTNECINSCKTVPYTPKNEGETGVIKSWSTLETAVLNHDPKGWDPHFLDEFVLISSNGTQVQTKADRLATLSKPGIGPAPGGLVHGQMFDFPSDNPETIVMIATAQGYSGKPNHISRIWVKRDGMWKMAFSYQTTIQSAPSVMPK